MKFRTQSIKHTLVEQAQEALAAGDYAFVESTLDLFIAAQIDLYSRGKKTCSRLPQAESMLRDARLGMQSRQIVSTPGLPQPSVVAQDSSTSTPEASLRSETPASTKISRRPKHSRNASSLHHPILEPIWRPIAGRGTLDVETPCDTSRSSSAMGTPASGSYKGGHSAQRSVSSLPYLHSGLGRSSEDSSRYAFSRSTSSLGLDSILKGPLSPSPSRRGHKSQTSKSSLLSFASKFRSANGTSSGSHSASCEDDDPSMFPMMHFAKPSPEKKPTVEAANAMASNSGPNRVSILGAPIELRLSSRNPLNGSQGDFPVDAMAISPELGSISQMGGWTLHPELPTQLFSRPILRSIPSPSGSMETPEVVLVRSYPSTDTLATSGTFGELLNRASVEGQQRDSRGYSAAATHGSSEKSSASQASHASAMPSAGSDFSGHDSAALAWRSRLSVGGLIGDRSASDYSLSACSDHSAQIIRRLSTDTRPRHAALVAEPPRSAPSIRSMQSLAAPSEANPRNSAVSSLMADYYENYDEEVRVEPYRLIVLRSRRSVTFSRPATMGDAPTIPLPPLPSTPSAADSSEALPSSP